MSTKITQPNFENAMHQTLDNDPNTQADAWDDLVRPLEGRKLFDGTGSVRWSFNKNALELNEGGDITDKNDRLFITFQKPHGVRANTTAHLHIHWRQKADEEMNPVFLFKARVQPNGGITETDWPITKSVQSSTSNEKFPRPTGTDRINQITDLGEIDWSGVIISSEIEVILTRSDGTAGNEDNPIYATTLDVHVCYDQRGSRQEWSK